MAKNKMTTCKSCGAEIAKSAKTCPQCGAKNKKPIFKRVWFWLIIVAIAILALVIASSGNQYKLSDDAEKMSEEDYKAACETIDYKTLSHAGDDFAGTKVQCTGEVQQVVSEVENGESEYMVAVTKDEFDTYDDNVYLYCSTGEKIVENDIITFYGEYSGTESYTSVLGESITIPAITAVYVDTK